MHNIILQQNICNFKLYLLISDSAFLKMNKTINVK